MNGWIGVDFDGTLSQYHGWQGKGVFGPPVPAMLDRVRKWVEEGKTVKIVTARAEDEVEVRAIHRWLVAHGLPELEVTQQKDFGMIELWDDRAVQVEPNTGQPLALSPAMRRFLEASIAYYRRLDECAGAHDAFDLHSLQQDIIDAWFAIPEEERK